MSKTIQVPKVSFSVARLQEIEAETEIKMLQKFDGYPNIFLT